MKDERRGTYADSSHDTMLEICKMHCQIARLEVVEHERDLATVLHARVAHRNVADPIVRGQTAEINERGELREVGPVRTGGEGALPILDEARKFHVEIEVNRELADPIADRVTDAPPEFVHVARGPLRVRTRVVAVRVAALRFPPLHLHRRTVVARRANGAELLEEKSVVLHSDARRARNQYRV